MSQIIKNKVNGLLVENNQLSATDFLKRMTIIRPKIVQYTDSTIFIKCYIKTLRIGYIHRYIMLTTWVSTLICSLD